MKENNLFVYHDEIFVKGFTKGFYESIYFWIFRSQKIVRWSENKKLYRLRNNMCSMSSSDRRYTLTLKDDFTVELDCRVRTGVKTFCFSKSLSPLIFQPCFDTIPVDSDVHTSECKSCKRGRNCVHPILRNVYMDVGKESMSLVDTCYHNTTNHNCTFERTYFWTLEQFVFFNSKRRNQNIK